MPATIKTVEKFPGNTDSWYVEKERDLRIAAGAISAEISGGGDVDWALTAKWNVIGHG